MSIKLLYVPMLLGLASAFAHAAPPSTKAPETTSETVSLATIDITTPAGLAAAQERLAAAAKRLCRKYSDSRTVSRSATLEECYRETLANALRSLNQRLLAARAERRDSQQ